MPHFLTTEAALDALGTHIWLSAVQFANGPDQIHEMTPEEAARAVPGMDADELADYNEHQRQRDVQAEWNLTVRRWHAWQDLLDLCGLRMTADEAADYFNPRSVNRRADERLLKEVRGGC